ncbi:MAG: PilZ domain-containing protein [Desulfobacterales bacterium]|nr:PilZ domain-containing protein [Desulfobacterales bacterium]
MSEEKSWDDIPSLDGLDVDWDFETENPLGKRKHSRMTKEELSALFEKKTISVKIVTEKFNTMGTLIDLSEGGIAVGMRRELLNDQKVRIGFFLGEQQIASRAIVRQVKRTNDGYKIGMHFHDIKDEYFRYIAGVYASKVLKH